MGAAGLEHQQHQHSSPPEEPANSSTTAGRQRKKRRAREGGGDADNTKSDLEVVYELPPCKGHVCRVLVIECGAYHPPR